MAVLSMLFSDVLNCQAHMTSDERIQFLFNSIFFCLSDPKGGYGPQDIEHVNSI